MSSAPKKGARPSRPAEMNFFQRKYYQYNVTLPLDMMTRTEVIIFNTFLFLFFAMIIAAATLYLPQHISTITRRAYFYYAGDENIQPDFDTVKEL